MKENLFTKKQIRWMMGLLLILMIIGSIYDFEISSAVFNQQNLFGKIFAAYGWVPAILSIAASSALMMKCGGMLKVLGIFINLTVILVLAVVPLRYIEISWLSSSGISLVLVVSFTAWILKNADIADVRLIKKLILLFLLVPIIELTLINLIKIPWARGRMRMIAATEEAVFQPWWVIGSNMKAFLHVAADELKSFPSAHTGNAACIFLCVLLPLINSKLKNKEMLLFGISLLFTFAVGVSRIIAGAHFLSDVTVGMGLTFLVEIFVYKRIFNHIR